MADGGEALMIRMATGDVVAFEELMKSYRGAAYRFAYRIFRDRHISEDVSQELFFKLFKRIKILGIIDPAGSSITEKLQHSE